MSSKVLTGTSLPNDIGYVKPSVLLALLKAVVIHVVLGVAKCATGPRLLGKVNANIRFPATWRCVHIRVPMLSIYSPISMVTSESVDCSTSMICSRLPLSFLFGSKQRTALSPLVGHCIMIGEPDSTHVDTQHAYSILIWSLAPWSSSLSSRLCP